MRIIVGTLLACLTLFPAAFAAEPFQFKETETQLTLTDGTLPILTYQAKMIEHEHVPKTDKRRSAGCYVHPLYGINGEVLTDNAPKDHYHHHGIFWTYPHVGVHEPDGKITEYDLWQQSNKGDVLKQHFDRWIEKTISEETAFFAVENGWFLGDPKENKKIMIEHVKMTVHRIFTEPDDPEQKGVKSRAIDIEFVWQPVDKPITLRGSEGKSYGGLSIRFKPHTTEKKSDSAKKDGINRITVPAGVAEKDLPETPLAWADYTSQYPSLFGKPTALSGAAIFVPRSHPDYPPTWLTRYYGPLCVGYPGVKGKMYKKDEKLELRYRVWIHDGAVSVPQIEKAYERYNKQ